MKLAKQIILALYGIQLFIIVPWFLGAMYRGEISPYVWRVYSRDLELHGARDAAFLVYTYVLFYSAFIFFPYIAIKAAYKPHRHDVGIVLILSLWFPITFLVFGDILVSSHVAEFHLRCRLGRVNAVHRGYVEKLSCRVARAQT